MGGMWVCRGREGRILRGVLGRGDDGGVGVFWDDFLGLMQTKCGFLLGH